MFDNSCLFEPTFTFNGIPISWSDVKPPFAVEGRKPCAVAHLAYARSQKPGTGILGMYLRDKSYNNQVSVLMLVAFLIIVSY